MKKWLLFSIIYLSLLSCMKKDNQTVAAPANPADTADTVHRSYLALGDSYTIGQSVAENERFPLQTAALLRQESIDISTPDIIAVTGWTTGDLLNALSANPPVKTYSFVSLLIGVNNQHQGRTLDEYKTQFSELLKRAIAYAGNNQGHVFVLSIPDYSVTSYARGSDTAMIAREIDAFNEANKNISLTAGTHYIDITTISRQAKNDPSMTAIDGLHPSGAQYKKWSNLLTSLMLQELH
ncbi:MAG: SGNH/GDSL hydrolase family protein [Ginsengibacter sp.]